MLRAGQYPTIAKYNRIPTREKVRFFWYGVAFCVASYQLVKFTVERVIPKREEYYYDSLNVFSKVPEKIMKHEKGIREVRETLTVHNATSIPSPGEFLGAMQSEFTPGKQEVMGSYTNKRGSRNAISS
ncbi:DNA-binding HTH domain containing protein [Perkinsela sp. CCAP 1560/4]|nr:DNA-binding HTH domain containing protein [Perkinsela sp. CCAP 1560/4]|eukprot:KNH03726.1 DNA-binding HTH domain containing protein [Perkinsela sp. CCAP 1560/4]